MTKLRLIQVEKIICKWIVIELFSLDAIEIKNQKNLKETHGHSITNNL